MRLVANAKYCQLGNRSACVPTRRVRRAISLQPWSLVSAICASRLGIVASVIQSASGIRSISARIGLRCLTPIENSS